jgi:chromosome segregation ATPase
MANRTIEVQGQDDEAIVYKVVEGGRVVGEYRKRLEPLLAEAEAKDISLLMLLRRRHDAEGTARVSDGISASRREILLGSANSAHEHDARYAAVHHEHDYADTEHRHADSDVAPLYRIADSQQEQLHRINEALDAVSSESADLRRRVERLEDRPDATGEHSHAEYLMSLPPHSHDYAEASHGHDEYQLRSNRSSRSRRRGTEETPEQTDRESGSSDSPDPAP